MVWKSLKGSRRRVMLGGYNPGGCVSSRFRQDLEVRYLTVLQDCLPTFLWTRLRLLLFRNRIRLHSTYGVLKKGFLYARFYYYAVMHETKHDHHQNVQLPRIKSVSAIMLPCSRGKV